MSKLTNTFKKHPYSYSILTFVIIFLGTHAIYRLYEGDKSSIFIGLSELIAIIFIAIIGIENSEELEQSQKKQNEQIITLQKDIKQLTEENNKKSIELQKQIHNDNVNIAYLSRYLEIYNAYCEFGKVLAPDRAFDSFDLKSTSISSKFEKLDQFYEYTGMLSKNAKFYFRNDKKFIDTLLKLDEELLELWDEFKSMQLEIYDLRQKIHIKNNQITTSRTDNYKMFLYECDKIINKYDWKNKMFNLNESLFNGDFTKHFEQYIKPAIKDYPHANTKRAYT